MTLITIDGNIGSGKSSILYNLHLFNKYCIDLEPVDNWINYLNKIYNENKEYFNFNIRVWLDRSWIQEKIEKNVILIERSPYFIKNVFIKSQLDNNLITKDENNILNELYKKTDNLWNNNIYIYIRTDPIKCFNRIKKRNRLNENNITLEYLNIIHQYHEINYLDAINNNMKIYLVEIEDKTIIEISKEVNNIILSL